MILTTVNHLNRDVRELTFKDDAGRTEKVRPTGAHKFYSDGRKNWLSAGDLQVGEYVKAVAGRVQVVSTRRLPGVEQVYNLEVEGEHVYYVSRLGALAHNNGCATSEGGRTPFRDPERPPYNNGATHQDHEVARVFGGPDEARDLGAETNLRKGGHEGTLHEYENELIEGGMTREEARSVIQDEITSLGNSPPPRPTDPAVLDSLPSDPSDQGYPY